MTGDYQRCEWRGKELSADIHSYLLFSIHLHWTDAPFRSPVCLAEELVRVTLICWLLDVSPDRTFPRHDFSPTLCMYLGLFVHSAVVFRVLCRPRPTDCAAVFYERHCIIH